ncbi:hypothetical protein CDIOL_17480 [Clostridium diolis]|uniref:Uncharacterized protein n=1 Tax=Clostridium diolis TaxID=223919 RepID=A0AAV3VZ27_9CLOT|nr:hypothetical protein CDIOL_17480 [Clostridium diolis]
MTYLPPSNKYLFQTIILATYIAKTTRVAYNDYKFSLYIFQPTKLIKCCLHKTKSAI